MLTCIIAPEGQGKTEELLSRLRQDFSAEKKIFVLVPEQVTAEYERKILSVCGPAAGDRVEVTNFSRLPDLFGRLYGGLAKRALSPVGEELLFAESAGELACTYRAVLFRENEGMLRELLSAAEELRLAGVDEKKMLSLSGEECLKEELRDKLFDLGSTVAAVRRARENSFEARGDALLLLAEELKTCPFFRDSVIYIDSFWDFTQPELHLIRRMLEQAENVTVTFVAVEGEKNRLFTKGEKALRAVRRLARQCGAEEAAPVFCHAQTPGGPLDFLKKNLLSPTAVFEEKPEDLSLTVCKNTLEEAEYVADAVLELVRHGARWNEIAVLSRSGGEAEIYNMVFATAGIPCFSEERRELAKSPLAATVLAATKIALGDDRWEGVANYLRDGLFSCPEEERALLEQYARTWHLSGKKWMQEEDLVQSPEGFVSLNDRSRDELSRINRARKAVFAPLKNLSAGMLAETNEEKIRALLQFLTESGAEKELLSAVNAKKARGDFEGAGNDSRLWNSVLDRLGEFLFLLGGRKSTPEHFQFLLKIALSGDAAGEVPPSQDLVFFGALPFSRPIGTKYVFLTGLTAGVFPPDEKKGAFLTASDREALEEMGLPLENREEEQLSEYFLFYLGVSFASEKLFLSYSRAGNAEGTAALSPIGRRVLKLFPKLETRPFEPENAMPKTREQAFAFLCRHDKEESETVRFLQEYFSALPEYRERLTLFRRGLTFRGQDFSLQSELPFAGEDVHTSYSRIEKYSICRFSYFARYLLDAKPEPSGEFRKNQAGSFVHEVLQKAFEALEEIGTTLEEISEEDLTVLNENLCRDLLASDIFAGRDARADQLMRSLTESTLYLLLDLKEEFTVSGFYPIFFEKSLGDLDGDYSLPLADGTRLVFNGFIDRVDHYKTSDGTPFVRVVDYKTGGHDFSLEAVANGTSLQMLLYLFALCQQGFSLKGDRVLPQPAGILYLNGVKKPVECKTKSALDDVREKKISSLGRTGLVVSEAELLRVQDPDHSGRFLPLKWNEKKQCYEKDNLISLEKIARLKKKVEADFIKLVEALKKGQIEAKPLVKKKGNNPSDPCQYCEFRPICRNPKDREHTREFITQIDDRVLFGEEENANAKSMDSRAD